MKSGIAKMRESLGIAVKWRSMINIAGEPGVWTLSSVSQDGERVKAYRMTDNNDGYVYYNIEVPASRVQPVDEEANDGR